MKRFQLSLVLTLLFSAGVASSRAAQAELKDVSINGGIQDGKARLVIDANLTGLTDDKGRLLFATALQHAMRFTRDKLEHHITATIDILQGEPKELPFTLTGEGEIKSVTGAALQDWSIRQESNNVRMLVLRPRKTEKADKPLTQLTVTIVAERDLRTWSNPLNPLTLAPAQPTLFNGYVKVESTGELDAQPSNPTGLVPIEAKFLPESMRPDAKADVPEPLAYRFHGSAYTLPLIVTTTDPELRRVVLHDFKLNGRLSDQTAAFTLTATARVKNPRGASLNLLSGGVALTELEPHPDFRLRFDAGQFVLVFDKPGEYPLRLKFNAAVRPANGWNNLDFRVASSPLQPVTFEGLGTDTQFEFNDAARPERTGSDFASFLPADGSVKLAWKEARPEVEGKLFYSAEMLSQISIGSGLMRQLTLLEFKVMQGELNRVTLLLRGAGNVTRVLGANVLSWNVEPVPNSTDRRLVVQFNQPQKDAFGLQVQMQTELGAFPQAVDAMQLRADGATRFAGHFRVVNEGAVRLEVLQASGLSQISPEQFPESDATKALFGTQASQRFAFRFSSADFALRVQADNVLPELSVSQLLAYHLGETELAIDAELELDIREAPVRELLLRVPKGFATARLNASGLSDYFLREPAETPDAELRLVYGQPISGRQVIQLRLERNAALGQPTWTLPRIELVRAKSTRGHIAVSADPGFRLTPERTQALTEIATAFFPRKIANIQAAFRLSEPAWEAALRVERLPQSIQADVFHLFSIGEGIAYGSSTMNYLVSGAPIATFRVVLSDEYSNVEFTGKDVRNWQKTTNGYTVQLHTPVSGTFTLLATYERTFKAQGDTLTFTGARPLDAQTEQGYTIVVSAYQFQVQPANVSPGLLALETAEVPAEYRLFFDAPILAAYRYSTRPFNLQLALSPLAQGETLGLVVDRAAFITRISKDGEVLTDARYFVKNRGNTHFKLALPPGTELWSATVNGATVVPVKDGVSSLIPLPQRVDPNAIQQLDLKLASRSKTPRRVTAAVPVVTAPVLLAEWNLEPDAGQRLAYRLGSLAPAGGVADASGFAGLARMFGGPRGQDALIQLLAILALLALAIGAWRWAMGNGTHRLSVRHLGGSLVGIAAMALAVVVLAMLRDLATQQNQTLARSLKFVAPVQQSGSALEVMVSNMSDEFSVWTVVMQGWPALLAILVWSYAWLTTREWLRPVGVNLGWTLLAWAALRWSNGAAGFFVVLLAFLLVQVVLPNVRRLLQVPRKPITPPEGSPAAAVTLLMLGGLLGLGLGNAGAASMSQPRFPLTPALSLRERENRRPVLDKRVDLASSTVFSTWSLKSGDAAKNVQACKSRRNLLPLPEGEGWGEGEPDDRVSARGRCAIGLTRLFPLPYFGWLQRPAVIGEWMWRSLLQNSPDHVADEILLAAQSRIPEPKDLDSLSLQLRVALGVFGSLLGKAVATSVEFDIQPRFEAEEVKNVLSKDMLTTKFVGREAPVTQPLPHQSLRPSVMLAEGAGDAGKLSGSHKGTLGESPANIQASNSEHTCFPLTPALSPRERELVPPPVAETDARIDSGDPSGRQPASEDEAQVVQASNARREPLPLPEGEGRGEGERVIPERRPLLLAQAAPTETQSNPGRARTAARNPASNPSASRARETPLAESIVQTIRVEEKFVLATAKVRWHATKGQLLPLVFEPAVLTRVDYPASALKLVQTFAGGKRAHQLLAQQDGSFDIEAQYQLHIVKKDGESGFALPTQHALVNRLALTLTDMDADVASPQAVSVERDTAANPGGVLRSNTLFNLVLAPVNNAWIGWKPRSRDVKREKAVFFAELFQLYVPAAGVVEGVHHVLVRPAQGELSELVFDVPGGATITDVIDPAKAGQPGDAKNSKAPGASSSLVSLWRFDPDARKLRVSLNPPQSRPFALSVRSQVATGPLPFEQSVGLLSVNNAAGQLGSLGVATGSEVQLDSATADTFSLINLEDFPDSVVQSLGAQFPGLTLRRAFRYAAPQGALVVKASPVEADVRVETQETLSLGEDRTVLAANLAATITRAGIFRLSFVMPGTLDVESISGQALSHWTELKAPEGRIITLHLKGKTEGQQQFAISLAGPGTKATTNYAAPRLVLREASKQRGQLVIVPEQGMRLQVTTRDGVTQLDPQKSGIRQKGVLAFRLLQAQWNLALDIEQVDPWVQVTSLQHLTVTEALVKVAANLQYQIENTGLKALRVSVPTNAESVRFRGEQVADFLPVVGAVTNGLQTWEVKLHRRIIGKYLLQATWQTSIAENSTNTFARGVQAADVNLQRGFVTVQSGGRLQVRADAPPAALQLTEWQSIPRALRQDMEAAQANYTFRLVQPAYQLALQLERHEATKLLPARVNAVTLTSVISDEGVMLTEARLEMVPGDKRLLHFTLPRDARFWFAFVNQNGVWPWTEQDQILIPLEQQSRTDKPMTVELYYSSRIGKPGGSALDLELLGPKFDLPLENISWRVYLNEKWRLADWKGTLQFQEDQTVKAPAAVDVQGYLQAEAAQNRDKTRQAEEYLSMGNTLLERGDPAQARRAFQSAYGLSTHDSAFNEDARVQLHNLKLQQALVGLNVRQAAAAGDTVQAPANIKELRNRKDNNYTQQEAKQIIDSNTAEVNDNFMRLAERLIQQQDAAVTAPAAIRAAIPQQGRMLTFRRAVQVDRFTDLRLSLEAKAVRAASGGVRLGTLAGIFVFLALVAWASRRSTVS